MVVWLSKHGLDVSFWMAEDFVIRDGVTEKNNEKHDLKNENSASMSPRIKYEIS